MALGRDCQEAEELYLIGYSYGDEQVNNIIRNARRYNSNLQITLVNPGFDDYCFAVNFLSNWGQPSSGLYEKIKMQFSPAALRYWHYKDKFSDFLDA